MTVNSSDPFSGIAVSFFICSLYFLPLKVPKVKRPLSSRSTFYPLLFLLKDFLWYSAMLSLWMLNNPQEFISLETGWGFLQFLTLALFFFLPINMSIKWFLQVLHPIWLYLSGSVIIGRFFMTLYVPFSPVCFWCFSFWVLFSKVLYSILFCISSSLE